jgi:FAD/FMN-containing dehydrogenase
LYGKTIDHVLAQDVMLADGSVVELRGQSFDDARRTAAGDSFEATCYRTVLDLAARHRDEVERRYPKVLRRVGGYNLDEFVDPGRPFNLAKMMVGSEGTLGAVLSATLNLVPLPRHKSVLAIQFAS